MVDNFQELFKNGYRARQEGRLPESRAIFLDAVRKAAEGGDRPSLAEALCGLAQAEKDIGNCEAARHHFANAAVLYRQIGPPSHLAYALRHAADLVRQLPQPLDAEPLYREAETIYREMGDEGALDLANTLRGLALLKAQTGDAATSRLLWLEARDRYLRCHGEAGVAECDGKLAVRASGSGPSAE